MSPPPLEVKSVEYAPYPKVDIADVDPPPQAMRNDTGYVDMSVPAESNPYVTPASVPSSSKNTMESVKDVFGKWGKKLGDTAKKTEDLAGNVWQHHIEPQFLSTHELSVSAELKGYLIEIS